MGNLELALSAYENALRHNPMSLSGLTQVAGIARIKENYPKVRALPTQSHYPGAPTSDKHRASNYPSPGLAIMFRSPPCEIADAPSPLGSRVFPTRHQHAAGQR